MKFAHLTDTHLGNRQYNLSFRHKDFGDAWRWCIQRIIRERVDFVIHSGDLFHHRQVDPNAFTDAVEGLRLLEDNRIRFFMVGGNHELMRTHDSSWLDYLAYESLITILTPQPISILNADIYGLSWPITKEEIGKIHIKDATKYNILVLHIGIDDHSSIEAQYLESLGFNYIALGHIHQPFESGVIHQPGSTETNSTTEYEWQDRGFYIVEDGLARKIINPKRRFVFTESMDVPPDPEAICVITTNEKRDVVLAQLEPHFKYVKIKPKRMIELTIQGKQRNEIEDNAFKQLGVDPLYAKMILTMCLEEDPTLLEHIDDKRIGTYKFPQPQTHRDKI